MTIFLRHLLEFLINPFFITLIFFALFIVFRKNQLPSRFFLLLGTIGLILFSTAWLPRALTNYLEGQYPVIERIDPDIHWVVVLSGGQSQHPNDIANNVLYSASIKRLVEGVRLYRHLPQAKLLLSGGSSVVDEQPEAAHLATLASWFEVPLQHLVVETDSLNTADQALAIKAWVKEDRFYLVTSAIHMPRAMALCRRQGLNPIPAPTDFTYYWDDERWEKKLVPNPSNLVYMNIAWHELLGRVWAFIVGQA